MAQTETHPLNPRTYLRHRIASLRREVEALRTAYGPGHRLNEGEQELRILEAELETLERHAGRPSA